MAQPKPHASTPKRVDERKFKLSRRQPARSTFGPNHIFVSRNTKFEQQAKKVEELLNKNFEEVFVHGMGVSINQALVVVMELEKLFHGAISCEIQTSTVNVVDDLFPLTDEFEAQHRQRPVSAIHIHITRRV